MTARGIRVAQFGMGPIGCETVRLLAQKPWAEVVGGIDIDPAKASKTVADLVGVKALHGCRVYPSFDALMNVVRPDVVVHTAGSQATSTLDQITPMIRAGVSVVSSCEELLFPALRAKMATESADALCREHGARVVGTGVNPGFVMDVLPLCMTGVSLGVEHIFVERVVDASTRRLPLQKKVGSGLPPQEFRELFRLGKMGHAGLQESAALIAHALGWPIDSLDESCEPVIAERPIKTQHFSVREGQTRGLHQRAELRSGGKVRVVLDLTMALESPDPHDLVRIEGQPNLELRISGGVPGDGATVAALVNTIPRLLRAEPGIRLMTDLALPHLL